MSNASGDGGAYQKLPPGWDCKYDQSTGNCYYINYFTKAVQLEDPRTRYKQLQNERCSTESIPLQHMVTQPSGSSASPYHVYPSNSLTAVRAFQERHCQPPPSLHNMSASPLLSSRGQFDMSSPVPLPRSQLTQTPRLGQQHLSRRSTIQETSFTNQIDTDAVVARIQNMFPTAGENHIRLLLKRYYNREAVVISALQVEKYPVTMPGPYVTPPAQRHLYHSNSAFYMTPPARRLDMAASRTGALSVGYNSRTAGPIPVGRCGGAMSMHNGATNAGGAGLPPFVALHGSPRFNVEQQWRSSPKPHSSPKMKLRYMKNIFPKADETLLLDILANADNNVQTASEKLISLGYVKRDFVPAKPNNRPPITDPALVKQGDDERHIPLRPKAYTEAEKSAMQALLKQKYPQIAERIILMALESVNYAEDRATQILQIVQEEDLQRDQKQHKNMNLQNAQTSLQHATIGEETDVDGAIAHTDRHSQRSFTEGSDSQNEHAEFQSIVDRMSTLGHNSELAKGADEKLLLADYVTWNGANPMNMSGQRQLANGPDTGMLSERGYKAAGRNPELCKGAKAGLAKGSIYAQNKSANIKCN